MALISSYLVTTKNLEPFFNSLITAKAPEAFTQKFLQNLEFKSTNDRLYIGLLKGLGFLDANGAPAERYFRFLDQSQSKQVLAEAVREAYGDLFDISIKANELPVGEVKNKLRTLTQGRNSEAVLGMMANTFRGLVDYSEWNHEKKVDDKKEEAKSELQRHEDGHKPFVVAPDQESRKEIPKGALEKAELHYNIQIHLPESRDQAVYDALFESLKKHLF
jgi:Family of unknown function (DUF5343)